MLLPVPVSSGPGRWSERCSLEMFEAAGTSDISRLGTPKAPPALASLEKPPLYQSGTFIGVDVRLFDFIIIGR